MDGPLYRYADLETRLQATAHAVGVILLAFALGAIGLQLIAVPVLGLFIDVFVNDELTMTASVVLTIVQFIGFIAVAIGYIRVREIDLFETRLPSLRDIGWIAAGLVTLFIAVTFIGYLIQLLGIDSAQNSVIEAGQQNPDFFLYMVPIAILFIGPGEELLFRGVVQGLLKRAYGVVPAILIASALFGIAHYLALTGTSGGKLTYIAVAGALGVVLGVVYELSENIVVPAIVHGFYNAILFLGNWAIETQDIPREAVLFFPWLF